MPAFLRKPLSNLIFACGRWWLLANSNRSLAFQFRLARRIAFAVTGDAFLKNVLTELSEIFEQGGKAADTARKIFREADRAYAAAVVAAALGED